ncbi:pentatricopeptide repeat-containing protein At1g56690, mitochondrial-like [Selaginella moellendorffii]|uniref:pentatricopeptide repeat-containing protein At1g56690, mitochondrial-like n=1 Tax=Selaginella moellendorffii TaxID=88036 RepID=UPI000D1C4515|nr:pentatricopeptide repeat-containing protein At1g56690, mitochondrial-like [Selaginella moellendorffii]|eukprot:XP_024522740.1 pentatricopeptide repeat-containing protein At1g56690, mitochondrial-like [Selaginella moellendorffii]
MLSAYNFNGNLEEAKLMPQKNLVTWNAMLAAYTLTGHLAQASPIFENMPARNVVSWISIIAAYAAYTQRGIWTRLKYFDKMERWDIYNADWIFPEWLSGTRKDAGTRPSFMDSSLAMYSPNGKHSKNLDLFKSMQVDGVKSVLAGSSHVSDVPVRCSTFQSLCLDFEMIPSKQKYGCMAGLFCRAGRIRDARDLVSSAPFVPDEVDWISLLGNQKSLREKIGVQAVEQALALDSDLTAPFVLLSPPFKAL